MAGENTPPNHELWLRRTEQRLRIIERHNHPPAASDPVLSFLSRAQGALMGGGTRTVTSAGVAWSSPFLVTGLGMIAGITPSGVIEVGMPPNTTVVAVHGHPTTTTVTVAGGEVPMGGYDSLWYDMPIPGSANEGFAGDATKGWHIVVSDEDVPVQVPPTWLRIVTRQALSTASPMYVWGDMVRQSPP